MSANDTGFFHCGRCGAIYQGPLAGTVPRRCPECGADPVPPARPASAAPVPAVAPLTGPTHAEVHRSRQRRRRKMSPTVRNVVVFLGIWVVLLGAFAVSVKMGRESGERAKREAAKNREQAAAPAQEHDLGRKLTEGDRVFLTGALPGCRQALFGFLQSATPETRAQWVAGGASSIGRMQRFYQSNPAYLPEEMPERDYVGLLATRDGPLVETLWTTAEGYRIEAVFRRQRDEWRLDWDGFVRYSDASWPMFLAGAGEPVAEFRLLARERLAGDRKHDPAMSLVFHPPRFGQPREADSPSPEFLVPRSSEPGRKLEALLRLHREGKRPFGARAPLDDPEDMIRVRVRVRREADQQGARKFVLEDVLAGHWLGSEESGIPNETRAQPADSETESASDGASGGGPGPTG